MTLTPIHQTPTDLTLAIMTNPPPVRVLAHTTLRRDDWRVDLHIIGESHLISVYHAEALVLHELLACIPVSPVDCLHHHAMTSLTPHQYQRKGYAIHIHTDECTTLPSAQTNNALNVTFPQVMGMTPVTRITWEIDAKKIIWRTLHVYPNTARRLTCVYSTTTLALQNDIKAAQIFSQKHDSC